MDDRHLSLQSALTDQQADFTAAEVHGYWVGRSILLHSSPEQSLASSIDWLQVTPASIGALGLHLINEIQEHLNDEAFSLEPLLREDELANRLADLAGWAQGILLGLGEDIDRDRLSMETRQALDDLVAIADVSLESDQALEEKDLESVVEYARMTAHLLYLELRQDEGTLPKVAEH